MTDQVAVYRKSTGALVHLTSPEWAPAEDDAKLASSPVPVGYSEQTWGWDAEARTFVADIARLRERKWAAVKAEAARAEDGGVSTPIGRVQTDADSRGKITGMVVMAMLAQSTGQAFDQQFTIADNTSVGVDAAAMIGIGLAAGAHVVACHAVAQAKRAQIAEAGTAAEIEAIDAESGWPE